MSRISGQKRAQHATQRMDVSTLKQVLRDERVWAGRGKVIKPEGASSHWSVDTTGGKRRLLVEVELMPSGQDITCKLATVGGGAGKGLWFVPAVGSIVRVQLADGALDGYPAIVAVEDCGAADSDITDGRALLVAADIVLKGATKLGGVDATEAVPLGTTQSTALNALADALSVYISAIQSIADPSGTATSTLAGVITTFKARADLSTIVKVK